MGSAVNCTGMNWLSEGKQALQEGEPMKAVQKWKCLPKGIPMRYTKENKEDKE